MRALWGSNTERIQAESLLYQVRRANSLFEGHLQQDMHELLLVLLEACLSVPTLRDALAWKTESSLTCGHCGKATRRMEDAFDLSVSICGDSVADCVKQHFQEEELGEGNEWQCEHCRHSDARTRKQLSVVSLPEVLIVHLKLFDADGDKLSDRVEFERHLELDCRYELVSVVSHHGISLQSGHYTAACHVRQLDLWAVYDDSDIYQQAWSQVHSRQAYVLCYRRVSPTVAIPHRELSSNHVVPLLFWIKLCSLADPGRVTDWTGPVVPVARKVAEKYGGLSRATFLRQMRALAERRREETKMVERSEDPINNLQWRSEWLAFALGRAGPPGPIPDQKDKNPLWRYFKRIYN